MTAYYNEIDPYAAAWLRSLIAAGQIAPGDVDERSIRDVKPDDLTGYTQCHFFAGIGVWSAALRMAGWDDDRPVWTGSCPCQPFSAAGKGGGFADDRHLWPDLFRLIAECRPGVVFGEQVASKDGLAWLDLVQADLEGADYASGAVDLCAAGVGAPHIRQRLWFVAERVDDAAGARRIRSLTRTEGEARDEARLRLSGEGSFSSGLADAASSGSWPRLRNSGSAGQRGHISSDSSGNVGVADTNDAERGPDATRGDELHWSDTGRPQGTGDIEGCGGAGRLANAYGENTGAEGLQRSGQHEQQQEDRGAGWPADADDAGLEGRRLNGGECSDQRPAGSDGMVDSQPAAGPTNGQWRDADWIFCRDGKWRPVEPGTFPLAHGIASRVGRLRAYGNAIVAQVAAEVIGAWMECNRE